MIRWLNPKHIRRGLLWMLCVCLVISVTAPAALASNKSPKATPEPLTPSQQKTLDEASELVRARLTKLAGDGGHGMVDALAGWMKGAVRIDTAKDGTQHIVIPAPKFGSAKSLPVYGGEDPLVYLHGWHEAMRTALGELGSDKKTFAYGLDASADADALDAWLQENALDALDKWVWNMLDKTKAISALSSALLDVPKDAEKWQAKQFKPLAHAPLVGGYATLKLKSRGSDVQRAQTALAAAGYMDESGIDGKFGPTMVEAVKAFEAARGITPDGELSPEELLLLYNEESPITMLRYLTEKGGLDPKNAAWWPAYLKSLRAFAWLPPENGSGPVLTYYAPASYSDLAEALNDEIATQYLQVKRIYESTETFVSPIAGEQFADLKKKDMAERRITVDLAALASKDTMAAYEALGARHWAEAMTPMLDMIEKEIELPLLMLMAFYPEPQPFPESQAFIKPSPGNTKYEIKNQSDEPLYAKLYKVSGKDDTSKGELVCTMFVRPGERVRVSIRSGYYRTHLAYGRAWLGEEALFGENAYYSADESVDYFKSQYIYTLVQLAEDSTRKANVIYNNIDIADF